LAEIRFSSLQPSIEHDRAVMMNMCPNSEYAAGKYGGVTIDVTIDDKFVSTSPGWVLQRSHAHSKRTFLPEAWQVADQKEQNIALMLQILARSSSIYFYYAICCG